MGAAVATVAGQTVAAILGLIINRKVNHEIKLNPLKYGMDSRMMGKIFAIRDSICDYAGNWFCYDLWNEQNINSV